MVHLAIFGEKILISKSKNAKKMWNYTLQNPTGYSKWEQNMVHQF